MPDADRVDSRAYAFAYVIRSPQDIPADFAGVVAPRFSIGLFLPQELAGRFHTARYAARVLLFVEDEVMLYTHPSANAGVVVIPMARVLAMETERFLLDCRARFVLADAEYEIPYSARDDKFASEFLDRPRQRFLGRQPAAITHRAAHLGDPLDLAFRNFSRREQMPDELPWARLFIASQRQTGTRWLGARVSWTPSDYVAVTNYRLLWMTNRRGKSRQQFGVRCCSCALAKVTGARMEGGAELNISIEDKLTWRIQVPAARVTAAAAFAEQATRLLARVHTNRSISR